MAIAKIIPILDKWLEQLTTSYTTAKISKMDAENRAAIKKAIEQQDQTDLEVAMGSTKPGLPSGISGTEIVDKLPGVK